MNLSNKIFVLLVPLLFLACAGNQTRQPEIKEILVTDIKENGIKLFSYSVTMSSPQKGMDGREGRRGEGGMRGRKGASRPNRESKMNRKKERASGGQRASGGHKHKRGSHKRGSGLYFCLSNRQGKSRGVVCYRRVFPALRFSNGGALTIG